MAEIWFASDHHFQHKNLLTKHDKFELLLRPEFDDVEHMNEFMIDSHNSVVRDEDTVWFLGDVVWKDNNESKNILRRLKGKKKLTPGNHDDIKFLAPFFDEIQLWKRFPEHDFICSHVPLGELDMHRSTFNVHGHLHEKLILKEDMTPDPRYLNVSMEQIGYLPLSLWQVKDFLGLH